MRGYARDKEIHLHLVQNIAIIPNEVSIPDASLEMVNQMRSEPTKGSLETHRRFR